MPERIVGFFCFLLSTFGIRFKRLNCRTWHVWQYGLRIRFDVRERVNKDYKHCAKLVKSNNKSPFSALSSFCIQFVFRWTESLHSNTFASYLLLLRSFLFVVARFYSAVSGKSRQVNSIDFCFCTIYLSIVLLMRFFFASFFHKIIHIVV